MSEMTRYAMYEYIKKGRTGESTKNSVGLSIYGIRTYRFDEKKNRDTLLLDCAYHHYKVSCFIA